MEGAGPFVLVILLSSYNTSADKVNSRTWRTAFVADRSRSAVQERQ